MKLVDYLAKNKVSQKSLADFLGVSQGRVWQWLSGEPVTPKYCPRIELWSNREVTCEELNDTVDWSVLRSTMEKDVGDRAKSSDDAQPPAGSSVRNTKESRQLL